MLPCALSQLPLGLGWSALLDRGMDWLLKPRAVGRSGNNAVRKLQAHACCWGAAQLFVRCGHDLPEDLAEKLAKAEGADGSRSTDVLKAIASA